MRRFYAPYWMWEDVQHGMYWSATPENEAALIEKAIVVLSDCTLFQETLHKVVAEWVIATKCNLTNTTCNRQAWLGQAACCYLHRIPETITRIAWGMLTPVQRSQANHVADKFINAFELSYGKQDQRVCI
jgi:hypothetical protein